jgi:hypothetical protein
MTSRLPPLPIWWIKRSNTCTKIKHQTTSFKIPHQISEMTFVFPQNKQPFPTTAWPQPLSDASLVLGARLRSLLHLPAGAGRRAAAVMFVCLSVENELFDGQQRMEKNDLRCLGMGMFRHVSHVLENKHD